ncbi:hypothetical protein BDQ17DRAFT_1333254 [Cyathus striatus]|nr:hypothetical protein BDQ17DRAFT_1333254 [Cyathus striatus]
MSGLSVALPCLWGTEVSLFQRYLLFPLPTLRLIYDNYATRSNYNMLANRARLSLFYKGSGSAGLNPSSQAQDHRVSQDTQGKSVKHIFFIYYAPMRMNSFGTPPHQCHLT